MCDCNCRYPANVSEDTSFGGYDCDCAYSQDFDRPRQCCCQNERPACDCGCHNSCCRERNNCRRCGICGCLRNMFCCR